MDYHGGDVSLFLEVLQVLKEMAGFFPNVRWAYILNRHGISGLHLLGLLPRPRLLEEVQRDVRKVLAYLEDEVIASLAEVQA